MTQTRREQDNLEARWRASSVSESFYEHWLRSEDIPVYHGYYVEDVITLPLGRWARMGGLGARLLLGGQQQTDGFVAEIPPAGALNPERHLYEELVYVLSGRGSTRVWQEHGKAHSFEWGAGSLFAVPLNAWHQFFNNSGTIPTRIMAATTAPRTLNLYHNLEFVFDNSFVFADRFSGDEEDYFSSAGHSWKVRSWETNFVPNVNAVALDSWEAKGAGASHMRYVMADGVYGCHIHQLSPVTYVQAHRHAAGAMILVLSGSGYEIMWREGEPKTHYELRPGAIVSPGNMTYHLHVNPNPEPLRQLAFRGGGHSKYGAGEGGPEAHMSELIPYEREDPSIRETFYAEVRSRGLEPVLMPIRQGPG
jgi:quercetin dioxygenase-like cupin family protein